MPDYLFLVHNDATQATTKSWEDYLGRLQRDGVFLGGSSIGAGTCVRREGNAAPLSSILGFIRIRAANLHEAREYLAGNPDFEAGATIEIRELTPDE